jgi:hypothetical protein
MANTHTPNTAATNAASAVVDEAVRITADNSRRRTETAQAALGASQRYLDFANQVNRDVFSLWSSAAEASLQTTFEVQNAALVSSQALIETSTKLGKDALSRWADVARQAQATSFKTYQSSTKLPGSLTNEV